LKAKKRKTKHYTFLAGAATYWKVAEVALEYNNLLVENIRLKKSLVKVEELKTDIDKLKKVDQKLRGSLSGYISIVEERGTDPTDVLSTGMDQMFGLKDDRSLFNSIPTEVPMDGFITRGFETSSILSNAHIGIDVAGKVGTPIKATADGIVLFSGWTFQDGYIVILKHKYNYFSFYKHNIQNLCQELEQVKKGQVIALLGDTGQITSGAHLHFEIWQGSKPLDPMIFYR
jgi:murein DD-endopeptidase MepM/ murein hydrolase activator NlpD